MTLTKSLKRKKKSKNTNFGTLKPPFITGKSSYSYDKYKYKKCQSGKKKNLKKSKKNNLWRLPKKETKNRKGGAAAEATLEDPITQEWKFCKHMFYGNSCKSFQQTLNFYLKNKMKILISVSDHLLNFTSKDLNTIITY